MKYTEFLILIVLFLNPTQVAGDGDSQHEPLRLKNDFQSPEEVVRYYCERDSQGFVWSGLLSAELREFTTWEEPPDQDTFYVAKEYKMLPAQYFTEDEALVRTKYSISGIQDIHGTSIPTSMNRSIEKERWVDFRLKRTDGIWKIYAPTSSKILPVIRQDRLGPRSH